MQLAKISLVVSSLGGSSSSLYCAMIRRPASTLAGMRWD
jgi:hypothetical protein